MFQFHKVRFKALIFSLVLVDFGCFNSTRYDSKLSDYDEALEARIRFNSTRYDSKISNLVRPFNTTGSQVSIPQGTIQSARCNACGNYLTASFQFHKVRFKGSRPGDAALVPFAFQFHKVRFKVYVWQHWRVDYPRFNSTRYDSKI